MDKNEKIRKHSKEKLLIYKTYLTQYLSVLTNQNYYKNICICEPFAGMGESNGEKGSALASAEIIHNFLDKAKNKEIKIELRLNDKKKESVTSLNEHLDNYKDKEFINITNKDANTFIQELTNSQSNNKLYFFYIDPFGYTQVDQKELTSLLIGENVEILIFIPTSFIYRFLKEREADKIDESYITIKKFLEDCGIVIKKLHVKNTGELNESLKNNFKARATSSYVYSYPFKNQSAPHSEYCLFFITHHSKGAEKFLQAKNTVKTKLKEQFEFIDFEEEKIKSFLEEYLKEERTNVQIKEEGLQKGFLPSEMIPVLKQLEEKDRLEFSGERQKSAYYLDEGKKIQIQIQEKSANQQLLF